MEKQIQSLHSKVLPISEVSTAEIERAIALMRGKPGLMPLNSRIEPHWIGRGDRFWYRQQTTAGHLFVQIEAATGNASPAFDHQAVAAALHVAAGVEVDPLALDVTALDAAAVVVRVEGRIYRCDPSGGIAVRVSAPDPGLLVSPDGRLGVLRHRDNLWIRDLATGGERPLTEDGAPQFGYGMPSDRYDQNKLVRDRDGIELPPVQTWWSPDSRRLVTARLDQRHLAPYPYIEGAPRDGSFRPKLHEVRLPMMGEPAGYLDWWIVDVETGSRVPIEFPVERMIAANNGIDDLKIGWADGGTRLLAISGMTEYVGAELLSVDLESGSVRVVLEDRSTHGNPLVAGGYGRPIARFIDGGREILWWSAADGWGHLYRHDTVTGALINRVTAGDWLVRDIVAVDETAGEIWFVASGREPGNPYHRYLYRVGLDGSGLTLMTPEPGDHMIVDPTGSPLVFDGAGPTDTVSPDFVHFAYDVSSIREPTRSVLRRRDGRLVATFQEADVSGLLTAGYRPPDEVVVRLPGSGHELHGLVWRPSDHDPARRYPVIDIEYGNPAVAITPRTFHRAALFTGTAATPAALAELGFIVIVVDSRGTPYRSRAFSRPGPGHLATMGLEDHIAFIEAVAADDPSLDLSRIGIAGQSFGGYTAIRALLEFPDIFRVGVAGAPQTAYHNMAAEAVLTESQGLPVYADQGHLRPTPVDIPLNFADLDCATSLDRLRGHLLIVAGEQDENVYPGTILQFAERAMRDDRNVELIWMPNQAHDALYTRYALRRSIEFLTRHLQGRLLPADLPPLPDPRR